MEELRNPVSTNSLFAPTAQEGGRVEALRRYEILDTPPEEAFDRLTDLATDLFGVDVAFVAFLDTDRQWFKSEVGLGTDEMDLAGAFCTHTLEKGDLLVIEDATEDVRVSESPVVTEAGLRFYAGVPIRARTGEEIGTFSIMDPSPRSLSKTEAKRLRDLAQMASDALERRREAREHEVMAQRFESVFEDPNVLAGILSAEGRLLRTNETSLQYIEESEEQVVGDFFWETPWWPADLRDQIRQKIEQAAKGEYVEYDADLVDAEGHTYSVEGAIRPVLDDTGALRGLIVSARDVTIRKQRERALRRAERQYQAVFDDPNILVGLLNPEGRVLDVNQTALSYVDVSLDAIVGAPFWETPWFEDSDILQERFCAWTRRAANGEYVEFEADLTEAIGDPLIIEGMIRPVSDDQDGVRSLLVSARNVTERVQRERELRRRRNLLEQAQRLAGAWEIDLETDEMSWSEKVYDIHEVKPGTTVSIEDGFEFYAPEARPRIQKAFRKCTEAGEPYDLELPIITAEGNRRWVRTVGAAVEMEDGTVTKVAGAFQDITERKREERRRREVISRVTNAIIEVDADWQLTLVNEQAEALSGMTEEEMIGVSFWDIFEEALGTRFEDEYRRAMRTREPTSLVEYYSGGDAWFDIQVHPNDDGGLAFYFVDVTEQKQRERRLDAVFNHTYQFTGLLETDGTLIEVNDTALQFGNLEGEDVLGLPIWETFWFEGRDSRQQKLKQAVGRAREGEFVRYQEQIRGDEEDRIVDFSLRPITDDFGNVTMIVPEGRDITELERSRRGLERYREYTSRMLDAINDLFFVLGEDGHLQRWNRRVAEVTGYTSEDISGMSAFDFIPESAYEYVEAEIENAFASGSGQVEVPLLRKDGTTAPYEFVGNLVKHPDGGPRIVGIGRDITDRKERERRLRRRRQKVELLYEMSDRLFRADTKGEVACAIVDVISEAFAYPAVAVRLLEDEHLVPRGVSEKTHEHMPERPPFRMDGESIVARAFRTKETTVFEDVQALDDPFDYGDVRGTVIAPLGGQGTLSVCALEEQGIRSFDRHLIEVFATYARLVLERVDQTRKLVEAKEEAEEAAHLKSTMLANMSHEIRTPLTSITGFAEILEGELEGEQAEFIHRIRQGAERLMKTLNSVLQLSQLEAGVYDLERERTDVGEALLKTIELIRPSAEEKGVVLTTDLSGCSVERALNREALNQIVENLLENAIKFTPEGGQVAVRAWLEDEYAVVEVEDTGVGIEEQALSDVFEAFKQESEGLDRKYEGSGLGLSIVKRLAEAHGGAIEAESQKGGGSRFTVRLATADDIDRGSPSSG